MEEHIIPDDDGKGKTIAFIGADIEFTDPVAYYKEREKRKNRNSAKAVASCCGSRKNGFFE